MDAAADLAAFQEELEQNRRDIIARRQQVYAEHGTFLEPSRKAYLAHRIREAQREQKQRKG